MQSIIDKLQTPQSFVQSVQELVIALQRTGDPGHLTALRPHLDHLAAIAIEVKFTNFLKWGESASLLMLITDNELKKFVK